MPPGRLESPAHSKGWVSPVTRPNSENRSGSLDERPRRWGGPHASRGSAGWISIAVLLVVTTALPTGPGGGGPGPFPGPDRTALVSPAGAADPLAIAAFTATPAAIVIGGLTYLNVSATGGIPPYHFAYQHLPLGCYDRNVSSNGCSPSAAQHYSIEVVVNDSAGATVSANTSLSVTTGRGGPPIITYFYATPATAQVLTRVVLHGNATSTSSVPTASLTFQFQDLPPGCASFNQTDLECVPTAAGTFHIRLQVTDAFGSFAVATSWLNVTAAPTTSSSTRVPGLMWVLPAAVVLVAVVAGVLLLGARRRPPRSTAARPWQA